MHNDSFQMQSVEGSSSLQYNAKMHICVWEWVGGRQGDKLISETYSSISCMCVGRRSETWIRSHTYSACEAVQDYTL